MAVVHSATLVPTKLELLAEWLPTRPWFAALGERTADVSAVGAFRFDDPAGEVGLETLLVATASGRILQVPLTYRGAPIEGAELVGTMQHSVLGPRWAYDACTDPVWLAEVVAVMVEGRGSAEELVSGADGLRPRTPTASARGTGREGDDAGTGREGGSGAVLPAGRLDPGSVTDGPEATRVSLTPGELVVHRLPGEATATTGQAGGAGPGGVTASLRGTWPGGPEAAVLVTWQAAG